MRIPFVIFDLQPIPSEFPYMWGKFYFFFNQCTDSKLLDHQKNTSISRHNPFNRRLHVHCKAILSPCRRWAGPGEWGAGTGFGRRSSPRKESSRSRRYLDPLATQEWDFVRSIQANFFSWANLFQFSVLKNATLFSWIGAYYMLEC